MRIELFERGREILGRYGYRPHAAEEDWAADWRRLTPDFPFSVPEWTALSDAERASAAAYLALRRAADRYLDDCESLHQQLLDSGIETTTVERYAEARELYEDTVIAFGEARDRLQRTLQR